MAAAGCGVADLMVSFEAAREVLGFDEIWSRGRGAGRQGAGRGPDRPVPRAGLRAARPDLLAGAARGARRGAGRRCADRSLPPGRRRAERPVPAGALAVRAEGGGAARGRLDQGRRAEGRRPPGRALPAAVDRPRCWPTSPATQDWPLGPAGAALPSHRRRLRVRPAARRGRLAQQFGRRLRAARGSPADRGHAGRAGRAHPGGDGATPVFRKPAADAGAAKAAVASWSAHESRPGARRQVHHRRRSRRKAAAGASPS